MMCRNGGQHCRRSQDCALGLRMLARAQSGRLRANLPAAEQARQTTAGPQLAWVSGSDRRSKTRSWQRSCQTDKGYEVLTALQICRLG